MFKRLVALSLMSFASVAAAHADPISGYFSVTGTDSFTSSSFTFSSGSVDGGVGGTFASFLTDGNAINFVQSTYSYLSGMTMPASTLPLFTTSESGETFTIDLSNFVAGYITNGTNGCGVGSTCLDVTANGFVVASGSVNGTGAGIFTFTSQYANGQPQNVTTTLSGSIQASPIATPVPTPEPASLALVGSGILGAVAFGRRKLQA